MTEWSITSSTGTRGLIFVGVAPERDDRVAHRGEVDDGRHAGEVLHEDPLGGEGDLLRVVAGRLAVARSASRAQRARRLDVGRADLDAVLVAQQVLQEDLDGVGQPLDAEVATGPRRLSEK